jgi:hypothetical protein
VARIERRSRTEGRAVDTARPPRLILLLLHDPPENTMDHVTGLVEYLLANPIVLAPLLLLTAIMVFALLKKLLKIAAIVAIAGGLYIALVEYFGGGI